jgi:chromosome segregation ATPase
LDCYPLIVTNYKDLDVRLTAVEGEVRVLRRDAAVALELARGADRDVSEFKATLNTHKVLLEALRTTQIEQGQKLDEHGRILNEHGRILNEHTKRFDRLEQKMHQLEQEMRGGFAKLATGMAQITTLLNRVIGDPESGGN